MTIKSYRDERLAHFLDERGRVGRFPTRKKHTHDQTLILEYLATKFEVGREYTEREVNALLNEWHTFQDWALLRRELFEQGYLNRLLDGSVYWRAPQTKLY